MNKLILTLLLVACNVMAGEVLFTSSGIPFTSDRAFQFDRQQKAVKIFGAGNNEHFGIYIDGTSPSMYSFGDVAETQYGNFYIYAEAFGIYVGQQSQEALSVQNDGQVFFPNNISIGKWVNGPSGSIKFYSPQQAFGHPLSVTIRAGPLTDDADIVYTLPLKQGAPGSVLMNDGAGNLSWVVLPGVQSLSRKK